MTIKIYTKEKAIALRLAKHKVAKMEADDKMKLALKLGCSIATIEAYQYGTGNNFETALRIIEG